MIWWLVDHAGLVYLTLGLIALGCAAAFLQTRRLRYLGFVGAIVILAGLFHLLTGFVITDRKQMVAAMYEMAQGVLEHKPDKVLAHLAPEFKFQGLGREPVARGVVETARNYKVSTYNLWNFDFEELDREKGTARLAFHIRVDHVGDQAFLGLCRATYVLDKGTGKWRIREFQVFNPIVDSNQAINIPIQGR